MKRGELISASLLVLLALLGSSVRGAAPPATMTSQPSLDHPNAVIIQLSGHIDDYTRDSVFRRFDEARQFHPKVIILNIDTWGGAVLDALEISRFIKRQDDVHTIAFVEDKAISAGAMIAMACDEIVMSHSASLGDCAPIRLGEQGLETLGAAERAKIESPIILDFQESAARNHRDPLLAAGMVDVTRVIYWVQSPSGERRFVDAKEYDELTKTSGWINVPGAPVPIKDDKILLVVDSDKAVAYGLASGKSVSAEDLAAERGYNVAANISAGIGEQIVELLSGTVSRAVLLIMFLLSVYMVFHAPGHGVAEIVGLVALGLMLGVPYLTGYVQWWEILIIFVGLALIAFEIVLPGHFLPGITGAILVLFGIVMTFAPAQSGLPNAWHGVNYLFSMMQRGLLVVAISLGVSLFLWFWLNRFLPKMPYVNRLILTATSGGVPARESAAPSDGGEAVWPPLGALGRAVSELKPGGNAEFFDPALAGARITSVISESGFLAPGSEVIVREVAGSRVVVTKKG